MGCEAESSRCFCLDALARRSVISRLMKEMTFAPRARRAMLLVLLFVAAVCLLLSASSDSIPPFAILLLFAEILVGLVEIAVPSSAAVGLPLPLSSRSPPSSPSL
jgi:hypothetical protein